VSKTNYPTDEELAMAVEKIMTVVREVIADFKAAAPTLVKTLSDDEWAKLKADEDRRRRAKTKFQSRSCRRSGFSAIPTLLASSGSSRTTVGRRLLESC
jgi:hypothetical protein